MSNNAEPGAAASETPGKGMRQESAAKWGKFSTQQAKYALDKAQRDVDAFAKGRAL